MADIRPGQEFASWNSIPTSEVGQAVKGGLMAYGMQKSGLTDFLNGLGQTKIKGSVAPYTGISDQGQLPAAPQAPQGMNWGTMMSQPMAPPAMGMPPAMPTAPTIQQAPTQSPQELGMDWLNGKLSSFTNPQASHDISVAQQMNSSPQPVNPAEWQSGSTGESKVGTIIKMLGAMG